MHNGTKLSALTTDNQAISIAIDLSGFPWLRQRPRNRPVVMGGNLISRVHRGRHALPRPEICLK